MSGPPVMSDEMHRQIRLVRDVLDPAVRLFNHQGFWRPVRPATDEERTRWQMEGRWPKQ